MIRRHTSLVLVIAGCACGAARAQLEVVANSEPQWVFSGPAKTISVVFRNPADQDFDGDVRTRICQTTSGTAALLERASWKHLRVLAQQTVIEAAHLDFPAVRARTGFVVQWLENTNRIIGTTQVRVYPTNLLALLKPLAGDHPLGVYDPQHQLAPLLRRLKVHFDDLEDDGIEGFSGRLAVIRPLCPSGRVPEGMAEQVRALAKKGSAVVWIVPPHLREDELQPSFYCVPENTNAVVVVQPELVADLADNPKSQLNLVYLCKLALRAEPLKLPKETFEP
jgi:hypothetical protein